MAVCTDNGHFETGDRLLHAGQLIQKLCCPYRQQNKHSHHLCQGGLMAQPGFGILLRHLREERKLSLRELAQLADIDHAYIYRLEAGDKESPSEDVVSKLIRALKVGKREAEILRYLAKHPETDGALVTEVLKDQTVTYEIFASVAGAAFRGTGRPDYPKLIQRVRRILADEESRG
jgi:transcriptional regulator with XRE-family HTH domain